MSSFPYKIMSSWKSQAKIFMLSQQLMQNGISLSFVKKNVKVKVMCM